MTTASARAGDSAREKIAVADSQQALAEQVERVRKRVAGMCSKR